MKSRWHRMLQFWQTLTHISTVVWLWGLGGSLVTSSLIGWGAQSQGIPVGWLIPGISGIALVAFLAIVWIINRFVPPPSREHYEG